MVEVGFEIWKSNAVFYPSNFYLTLFAVYIEVSFYSRTEKVLGNWCCPKERESNILQGDMRAASHMAVCFQSKPETCRYTYRK